MANNKTLLKAIERKTKRLDRIKSSLPFTKQADKKLNKLDKISEIEKEILILRQQIQFNNLMNRK